MVTDATTILPPLLRTLTVLEFVARHLDPMTFDQMFAAVGTPDEVLREALHGVDDEDEPAAASARLALSAFDNMRTAMANGEDLYAIYGALRHLPRALEALYPLAARDPIVNSFYLDASLRDDADIVACAAQPPRDGETGVMHFDNERGSRGGYSLYVPESYSSERPLPLVMALHGGNGHGRAFLWSWLRDARSFEAIVVAPTATGRTWALMGDDTDTPNLYRILDDVSARWQIDPTRLLLTGMSEGGTFCYVSGLEAGSRFTHLAPVSATFHPMMATMADAARLDGLPIRITHLAPVSATFHPMMATMADAARLNGLPIRITHGARDWMFPVEVARRAAEALAAAGADVGYGEIEDLSHCYPREINTALLAWVRETPR